MGQRPAVSVVVSTRNRASLLPRLFSALSQQTFRDFEVVIVDDGSTDDTAAVLAELSADAPFPTAVLHGRGEGPAIGRELGWRHARADLVAFTDDDCVPTPGWLAAATEAMPTDRPAVVVGRTLPNPDQAANHGPFSRSLTVQDARFFQTANICYRRADLEAVGGFDPTFDKPGGEDTDLGLRLVDGLGAEAIFAEEALVHHDVRPPDLRAALREARRWTGVPLVVAKHPSVRRDYLHGRLFWRPSHPRAILAWAGLAGVVATPATLGLLLPWLWYRTYRAPIGRGRREVARALPGTFLVDSTEVVTMVRGSVRARTLVL